MSLSLRTGFCYNGNAHILIAKIGKLLLPYRSTKSPPSLPHIHRTPSCSLLKQAVSNCSFRFFVSVSSPMPLSVIRR